MAEYQLVSLWKIEVGWTVGDIRMSVDGQYLLIKGDGRIAYYNWGPQLLWQGETQNTLRHVAVSSNRDQVLAASDNMVYSFSRDGDLLWDGLTEWKVQVLHLNATAHCIVASNGGKVGCLDKQGKPIWQHDLRKTVRSVVISPNGQWILAGGEDNRVTCLSRQGQVVWTSQFDRQVVSISAGEGIVAVGDASKIVHCLDSDGYELCHHEMRGQLKSVAASANGKYVAVGTESELHQFFFTDAAMLFVPIRPKHAGVQNALEQLGTNNIQNVFINHDGGCLVVEGKKDGRCYDLGGTLLWSCPKIDVREFRLKEERRRREEERHRQEEERRRREKGRHQQEEERHQQEEKRLQRILEEGRRAGEELLRKQAEGRRQAEKARQEIETRVQQIRHDFAEYVRSQSRKKARETRVRENVPLGGETLDLYCDGKGYLFVPLADLETVRRATKLAKHAKIYIIAHDAPNDVVQRVKRTRGVNLYRLSDMTKTTGWRGGSDFETFMQLQGKKFTRK